MIIYCATGLNVEVPFDKLNGIPLENLNLHRAELENANLIGSSFVNSNLRGIF
ncbi:MAG: pentapeptide repeat-containing protein [Spirosomataceae bacterium]